MSIVFMNGQWIDEGRLPLSPRDRGVTLGDSVFDTMRVIDGHPVRPLAHLQRLYRHAQTIRLTIPVTLETLITLVHDVLRNNDITRGFGVVRTTVTRGVGARGVAAMAETSPTLMVTYSAAPPPHDMPDVEAHIAQTVRRNDRSPLSRIKSGNYADMVLAMFEAKDHGCSDSIILNTYDRVTCATTSNVFILEDGRIITPPLSEGVLDGTVRQCVIDQYGARIEPIDCDRLAGAEEIWLANTVSEMRAVARLADRPLIPYRRRFHDLDCRSE